ncbi:MAG: class I SAM-dependent methyltransferase [Chloroflexi bacterium]|nr:class I SAM-dependent methyltransferase [Chloroflexota bacterium]MCI0577915.1 class I SAM-dependent methyltransferase [Chloroflexota bacterium]MCI0645795.1 class I SAM-dependent methyltransferase [Chloroflexota bacterium]MCI0727264.1 class I SAM-dependent methyltransferase [Chloroflexota bacterium]
MILPHVQGGHLLDVGCGWGYFTRYLLDHGWQVTALDPSPHRLPAGELPPNLAIFNTTFDRAELPEGTFDAVTFWHVLEHLPDPIQALARARRLLKPGGIVVVGLPDFAGWQSRLFGRQWDGLRLPLHLHHFDRRSLTAVLRRCGYEPVQARHFFLDKELATAALSLGNVLGLLRLFTLLSGGRRPLVVAELLGRALVAAPAGALLAPPLWLLCTAGAALGHGANIAMTARYSPRPTPVAEDI